MCTPGIDWLRRTLACTLVCSVRQTLGLCSCACWLLVSPPARRVGGLPLRGWSPSRWLHAEVYVALDTGTRGAWVSRADCGWPARQLMTGLAGDETSSTDGSSRLVNTCGCWLLGAAANYPVPGLSLSVPGWLSRSTFIPLSDPDVSIAEGHSMTAMTAMTILSPKGTFSFQDLNGTEKSKLTHPAETRTRKGKNKKRRGRGPCW